MILLVCHVFCGAYYREKLRDKYRQDVAKFESLAHLHITARDFDTGLFECCSGHKGVRKYCFALWCAPVRFAADASAVGFMDFWIALIMMSIFFPIMWIFGFIERVHIREEYGMERHVWQDWCSWFWCYCIPLVQEAKFVDNGFRALRDGRQNLVIGEPPGNTDPDPRGGAQSSPLDERPVEGNTVPVRQTESSV